MPTTAKPPKPIVEPSGMSATAASKVGKILDLGMGPPNLPCHTGEGRYPRRQWVPAFAGTQSLSQLPSFGGAAEEDVRLQKHRQHQRAVRRTGDVAVAFRAPDVIARGDLALVIDQTALDDEGLLDLDMLVQCQLGAGLPTEQRRHQARLLVFEQDLHLDPRTRG